LSVHRLGVTGISEENAMIGRAMRVRQHVASTSGPASFAALRDAVCRGREPPPAHVVARLQSYRWFVVGTICVAAVMAWVDSSITQMLLPRLEQEFGAKLSIVSWVAVAYLLAMAAFCRSSAGWPTWWGASFSTPAASCCSQWAPRYAASLKTCRYS